MRNFFYAIFSVILNSLISYIFSQPTFEVKVNSTKISLNQHLTITYTLKNGRSQAFERPSFEGFHIVGQRSMTGGGSFQIWINNQRVDMSDSESSESWSFTLMPTRTGTITIPPARVKVNNQWLSSESLTISITSEDQKTTSQPMQTQQQNISQQQKTLPAQQQKSYQETQSTDNQSEFFIRAFANKSTIYVGEPVVITYKLFTRIPVLQYIIEKTPSFDGFWSENLLSPQAKPQQSEEEINGQKYATAVIRKVVLFPQRTGTFTIDPMEVKAIVRTIVQRQTSFDFWDKLLDDFFNDPFFRDPFSSTPFPQLRTTVRDEERVVFSNGVTIKVKELPTKNRTVLFNGQVGRYSIDAWVDKNRLLVDEALQFSIKITGNGNLNLLDPPKIELPEQFEVFEPEVENDFNTTSEGISGSKTFSWTLIPRVGGKFIIPPVEFTYFDLQSNDYVTLRTKEFEIEIVGQGGTVQQVVYGKKQANDIIFIKYNTPNFFYTKGNYYYGTLFHISLTSLPFLLLALFIILMRRHVAIRSNQKLLLYRKAVGQFNKKLKKASKLLNSQSYEEFYSELSSAIWNYFVDRFFIERSQLSTESIQITLKQYQIEQNLIDNILNTLQACEMARFAQNASPIEPKELITQVSNFINSIEQIISKNNKA